MNLFTRLPGYRKTPAGVERRILRNMPKVLIGGTLALALPSLAVRAFGLLRPDLTGPTVISMIDFIALGAVMVHVTLIVTVTIGAFIVMVMKGPAYVADAYPLSDSDLPR